MKDNNMLDLMHVCMKQVLLVQLDISLIYDSYDIGFVCYLVIFMQLVC